MADVGDCDCTDNVDGDVEIHTGDDTIGRVDGQSLIPFVIDISGCCCCCNVLDAVVNATADDVTEDKLTGCSATLADDEYFSGRPTLVPLVLFVLLLLLLRARLDGDGGALELPPFGEKLYRGFGWGRANSGTMW